MQSRKRRHEGEELKSTLAQKKYSSKKEPTARRLAEEMLAKCLVHEAEQAEDELQRAVAVHNECVKSITKDVLERMETARWSFVAEYLSEKATQRKLRQELQEMNAFRSGGDGAPGEHLRHWEDELPTAAVAKKCFADKHLHKRRNAETTNLVNSSDEHRSWSERSSHNKDNYPNFHDRAFNYDHFEEENRYSVHQDINYPDNNFCTQSNERHRNSHENKNAQRNFRDVCPGNCPEPRFDGYLCQDPQTDFPLEEAKVDSFRPLFQKHREEHASPNKCCKHKHDGKNNSSFTSGTNYHSLLSEQRNEDKSSDPKSACHLQSYEPGKGCLKSRHDLWYEETRKKFQRCRIDTHHCSCSAIPRHNFSESSSASRRERCDFCECRPGCESGISKSADDRYDPCSDRAHGGNRFPFTNRQPASAIPTHDWKGISNRIYEDAGILGISKKSPETTTSYCPKHEVIEGRRITSCVGEREATDRCLLALIDARDALVEEMSAASVGGERRPSGTGKERLAAIAALNVQIRSLLVAERGDP